MWKIYIYFHIISNNSNYLNVGISNYNILTHASFAGFPLGHEGNIIMGWLQPLDWRSEYPLFSYWVFPSHAAPVGAPCCACASFLSIVNLADLNGKITEIVYFCIQNKRTE